MARRERKTDVTAESKRLHKSADEDEFRKLMKANNIKGKEQEIKAWARHYFQKFDACVPIAISKDDYKCNEQFVYTDCKVVREKPLKQFLGYVMNGIVHVGMVRERRRRIIRAVHIANGVRYRLLRRAAELKCSDVEKLQRDEIVSNLCVFYRI